MLSGNSDAQPVQAGAPATPGEPVPAGHPPPPRRLSQKQLLLLALASAVVTANAYYIHPIISLVARDYGVSDAMIGAVPALNQIALAVGIFLLLPLGDRFSNRRLVSIFVTGQFLSLAAMAFARDFGVFVFASTLLGFMTIAPYLLPAYVSRRVDPSRLGNVTAVLTTGIIAGILVARVGAGFIGEHFGWRAVYFIAAGLMLLISLLLPFIMESREKLENPPGGTYRQLIGSIFPIVRENPEILLSGAIQGLSFGIFLAIWMGLGLHLPALGYGVDVVGYLAAFTLVNLVMTTRFGNWADRIGARRARLIMSSIQLFGTLLFTLFGHSLWLLMVPILMTNLVGPVIDITGRMTFLGAASDIRTRLMTVYIVMMFTGGGMASWAATAAYDWAGWRGTSLLALAMAASVFALCLTGFLWRSAHDRRSD